MSTAQQFSDIGGIVLDAVGTLIEPRPTVAEAYAEAAQRQGVVLDPAVVRRRFREQFGADEVDDLRGPLATDEAREERRWRRIVAGVLPELPDLERGFAELWDHFGRPGSWRCFDDVGPALNALAEAGRAVRIASNFDARLRVIVQGRPELAAWADRLVLSTEVGYRKPHPAFYRAACVRLGLPPGRVLCVGDDPEHDVRGPERAGLRGALIDREGRAPAALLSLPNLTALTVLLQTGPLRTGTGTSQARSPFPRGESR